MAGMVVALAGWVLGQGLGAELRQLAVEDQADRKFTGRPTVAQEQAMEAHDRERRARARQILENATDLDKQDLDAAALIFQHGDSPEDFSLAHVLAIGAGRKGALSSLTALSEDRFLRSVHQRQRFGSQFEFHGDRVTLAPVEAGRAAVTDDLRLDFLTPPLEMARKLGLQSVEKAQDQMFARIEKRRNPKQPLEGDPEVSKELASTADRRRVLELYASNKLVTDDDFLNAARVLSKSSDLQETLLAHEMATLAFEEGDGSAGPVALSTWNVVLARFHRQPVPDYPAIRSILG